MDAATTQETNAMLQAKTAAAPRGEPASGDLLREFQRLKHKPASDETTNQSNVAVSAPTTTSKYAQSFIQFLINGGCWSNGKNLKRKKKQERNIVAPFPINHGGGGVTVETMRCVIEVCVIIGVHLLPLT